MKILDYEKVHEGESCFILGSGPSLNQVKPEDFVGIPTFVCNDAFLRAYTAKYWVTGDPFVLSIYENLRTQTRDILPSAIFSTVGRDTNGQVYIDREILPSDDDPKGHPLYPLSLDPRKGCYEADSPVHLALQVAVWMGFKAIYLHGADYGRTKNLTHFYGERNEEEPKYSQILETMHDSVKVLEGRGVRVYNCARTSKLRKIRFIEYRDALSRVRAQYVN